MESGAVLKSDKLYYTKSGMGKVIPFNLGVNHTTREFAILVPSLTDTKDVWISGWLSRNIKDIAESEIEAIEIKY